MLPGEVEFRMRCPVCGRRNHHVTLRLNQPTQYHDCGHTDPLTDMQFRWTEQGEEDEGIPD